MAIENPTKTYEELRDVECFHMNRELWIFINLCEMLQHRGKIQPYKCATLAEYLENEIERWEKFNKPIPDGTYTDELYLRPLTKREKGA